MTVLALCLAAVSSAGLAQSRRDGPAAGWNRFQAPDGTWSILLPEPPRVRVTRLGTEYTSSRADQTFLVVVIEQQRRPGAVDTGLSAVSLKMREMKGSVALDRFNIIESAVPGAEFALEQIDGRETTIYDGRTHHTRDRLYLLMVGFPPNASTNDDVHRFLSSFRLGRKAGR